MKTNTRAAIFAVSRSLAQAFLIVLVMAVRSRLQSRSVAEPHKSVLICFG